MPAKNKEGRIFLLDRSKAAKTGTIWLSVFQEAKTIRDLIGGANIANPGGFAINEGGSVATFSGAQQQNLAFTLPAQDNIIIAARVKATAGQAADPGAAFGIYSAGGNQSGFAVGFNPSNEVGCTYLDNNGAGTLARSAGSLNVWYTVFIQARSDSSTYAWINGKPATTGQGSTHTAIFSTLDEICIGAQHRSAGFLRNFTGNIEWAAILNLPVGTNNTLTDAYAEYLYESNYPYSLEAKPSRIFAAAASGTVWNVSVSESITLADAPSSLAAFQSAQAESIALADSQSVTNLAVASIAEAMTLSDTPSAGTVTGASIAEAITLAESVSSSALYAVSLAEALTLADAVTSALTAAASVAEAIALSEAASVTADFNVSIAESVALADSSSTSGQVTSADITESIALTDALTASALFTTAEAESISLGDVLIAAAQFQAAITEAMALVDSSSTSGLVLSAAIVESMSLIDAWSATASLTASVIEALSLVDLPQAIAQMGVVQVEALALADSTTGNAVYTVAISELVTLADVVDWVAGIINTDKYPLAGVQIIRPLYGVSIQYPLAGIKRTYP